MITTLPAVQRNCKKACRVIVYRASRKRWDKTHANRRYRRVLNESTRRCGKDPERFYSEGFNAPSLSSWEIY